MTIGNHVRTFCLTFKHLIAPAGVCIILLSMPSPKALAVDMDCSGVIQTMKDKKSWWRKDDLASNLEEWIKASSINQLRNQSKSALNVGVVLEGIPFTIGGETSEDTFRYIQQELAAGRHLVVTSHTTESFIEETLNPDFKDILMECLVRDKNGLFCRLIRSVNPDVATLLLEYKPIPAATLPECRISLVYLEGATFMSEIEKENLTEGFKLTPHKRYFLSVKRIPGGDAFLFKPIEYKLDTTVGDQIQGSLPPIKHPKDSPVVRREGSKTEQVFGGSGNGGGGYMDVKRNQSPRGSYKIVLGPVHWPRVMDALANNLSVVVNNDQTGIWAINSPQHLFDGESMKISFTNVKWNESEHSLSFDWAAGFANTRQDDWEVHIRVTVNVLTTELAVLK